MSIVLGCVTKGHSFPFLLFLLLHFVFVQSHSTLNIFSPILPYSLHCCPSLIFLSGFEIFFEFFKFCVHGCFPQSLCPLHAVPVETTRGHLETLGQELPIWLSVWGLRIKSRSSVKAASAINFGAISPAPGLKKNIYFIISVYVCMYACMCEGCSNTRVGACKG